MRDLLNKLTLFESTQEGFDPETFDFDFQFDAIGDDGEQTTCTVSATANIEEGKPVVDPKSLSIDCPMDGNSKLGFDADIDLEMQDMDDMMNVAQEEADEQWAERDNKYSQGENVGEDADEEDEQTFEGEEFYEYYGYLPWHEDIVDEAEYRGRKVKLGKPMQGDVKKFKVYVRDPKTKNIKKVNFGDPNMRIKKSNPKRRKSFRARHNCDNPGPRTKARYWSCRKW